MKQLGSFLAYESSRSALPDSLIHAYATIDFPIRLERGSAVINIGEQCLALDQYLLAKGEETAVILSASNPLSQSIDDNLVFLGETYEGALQLATKYEQSAFVWYVLSSRAKLVVVE